MFNNLLLSKIIIVNNMKNKYEKSVCEVFDWNSSLLKY